MVETVMQSKGRLSKQGKESKHIIAQTHRHGSKGASLNHILLY